jgi:hypothetical protein
MEIRNPKKSEGIPKESIEKNCIGALTEALKASFTRVGEKEILDCAVSRQKFSFKTLKLYIFKHSRDIQKVSQIRRSLALKPQNYIFFKHSSSIQKLSQIRQKFEIIWTKWSVFSI